MKVSINQLIKPIIMKFKKSNSVKWKNTSGIMLGVLFIALLIVGCSQESEDAIINEASIEETSIESAAYRGNSNGKPFKGSFDLSRVGDFPFGGGTGVCGYVEDLPASRGILGTSGQGNSTLMGLITVNSDLVVNLAGLVTGAGPSDGLILIPIIEQCAEFTAANGDKVFIEFDAWDSVWDEECECRLGNFDGEVTGGTGRFEDATGTLSLITRVFPNENDGGEDDLIEVEHDGRLVY